MNPRGQGGGLREEILDAAAGLLAASGARDGVTLRAIARQAGIAAPSIYPHFPSRDAILDAVVSRTFAQLGEAADVASAQAPSGSRRVAAICDAYIAFAREHPGEYRILFDRSPSNVATPAHPYPAGLDAFRLLEAAIEQTIRERGLTSDPTRDAQLIWMSLHGLATLLPATPGFPWADSDGTVRRLLSALGYGPMPTA